MIDPGSQGEVQIWQCTNPDCCFRYPVLVHAHLVNSHQSAFSPGGSCPKCGSQALLVHQHSTTNSTTPGNSNTKILIHPVEVLLDNIRSTFNVGAIFRSSDGSGVRHIHICGTTPTPEHPKISKTALGAENSVAWSYHPNALMVAQNKKEQGYDVWALEGTAESKNIFEIITQPFPKKPILLVIGNEVTGVDPDILDLCNTIVAIPMLGYKRSLNVAIAFGIAIYTICISAPLVTTLRNP